MERVCGILPVMAEQWLICPACGKKKILRVRPDTVVRNLPVYCKRCRREVIVNIEPEPVAETSSA